MSKFISLILLLFSVSALAQTKPEQKNSDNVKTALTTLKNDKDIKNAAISFLAIDLKTGKTLAALNPDMGMIPASTQKLFTTATVLELAGTGYRFKTKIQYTGTINKQTKTLNGNLIIKGGGDPTLGSKFFYKNHQFDFIKVIITAIKSAGIEKITGRVIADASVYTYEPASPKWLWEEVANYYAVAACGLSVYDNLYELHFTSPVEAGKQTKIIKIYPEIPNLSIQNYVLSSNIRSDEAYIYGAPYTYKRTVRGTIPRNKADFIVKGAMPDPAYFLAKKIQQELDSSGIHCLKPATTVRLLNLKKEKEQIAGTTIKTLYSPSLIEIINTTNHKSNNLFAEHLLNLISIKRNLKEKSQSASAKELINFWQIKGMDINGLHIVDGSGLSRLNLISARQFIFLLKYMKKQSKNSDAFINTLPVAGKSGTLKYLGRGTILEGNMQAKSGSVERVRAFAGYIKTKSGKEVAFSVNVANYNCSSRSIKQKISNLLLALANI
jgi:D-alanyl-D-alanine carboxypeptidase/D-alanyl-D-alanine-endopeptidase (penicillin-binding protein 4)